MDELLSIPIHKELNVIQINIKEDSHTTHKLENIPIDTSVLELQEQIFCKSDIPIENQYLFYVSPIDSYFYGLIDELFRSKNFLSRDKVLEFLDKILHEISDVEFSKTRISREILLEELERKQIMSYLKPLNISFKNGIEFIRIDKNRGLSDTFVESNQSLNLSNFKFIDNKIFMFSKKDIDINLDSEIKKDIVSKYFLETKSSSSKEKICQTSDEILSIYQDGDRMTKFRDEYGKNINEFIQNKIVGLSLLFTNFKINECDIQKIFNSIKLDSNVVFSKISMRRKKHYFKIFKPMYFGDDAVISKKQFGNWRNIEFTPDEKEYFDINAFIVFKILYSETNGKKDFITLIINQKNQLLLKLESGKIELNKLRDILFQFLTSLNPIVDCFKNIDGDKFLIEDNYKILDLYFIKEITVDKNIPIKNLRDLLEKNNQYLFSLDYPINERKFIYGYKRTSNFMVDKNVNYLIEKMVFTEGQTDSQKVKSRLKNIFPKLNVNEKYMSFLGEYENERKSKYKLLMPHITISTNENKFIVKMKHFDKLSEIQIVSLLTKSIFEEFMVKKTTIQQQPAIRTDTELALATDESSESSNSNSNSDSNSSPQGAMVGLNNSNSEESLSSEAPTEPTTTAGPADNDDGEIDISFGYEGKNYTSYMKAMRSHYDAKLFDGKEYTKKCRRQPYIVSKQHFERNINKPNQFNTIGGLDSQIINSKGDLVDSSNYFLESLDGKKVYICPRIWCVRCNLPVDPVKFAENKICPKCNGAEISKSNGKMTSDKTIIIVNAENDYYKTSDKKKNYLKKIFDQAGIPIPDELKGNEHRMYPKFLDEKKNPDNKGLPCCYKGMSDDKIQSTKPETRETEVENRQEVVDQKVFRFITDSKFPMKKLKRLAILPDDIDILLDNTETNKILEKLDDLSQTENKQLKELKSKKTLTAKQANTLKELEIKKKGYEYSFKFYGERKNIGFKRGLSTYKMGNNYVSDNLFRLSVGDNKNTSFIDCIEELSNIVGDSRKITEIIENEDIFTPLLFSQLNNGNLIEIFRSDIDNERNYNLWKDKYRGDLEKLKLINEISIQNLYSSFTNFKKYNHSDSYKNPEFYLDLLGRPGLIFDEPINILILEKTSYEDDSKLNLICPKSFLGSKHINPKNNSIILLNTGQYYEPIVGIRFITRKMELNKLIDPFEPIIFFNSSETNETQISRTNITTIMKLTIQNCNENLNEYKNNVFTNNLDTLVELRKKIGDENISKYIIGNNLKIVAIYLKNKLVLPVIPSGISEDILDSIENMEFIRKNLITIEKYMSLVESDGQKLEGYTIKNYISSGDKIHSLLLNNGSIIPIKKENISGRETIDFEDVEVDNFIIDRVEEEDDRVKFNMDYNNYIQEQGIIKYIFNSFIREFEQEEVRDVIKKIIVNPVMPMVVKKKKLNPIISAIVGDLFVFKSKPDIFGKGKKTKKCYKDRVCDKNCEENVSKCKNKITKKNILTNKDNKKYYIDFLIDELIRKNEGIDLITKKINMLSEMDVTISKDEIVFPDDLFEYQETDLYRRTKEKFVRNIDLFNTINQNQDINIDEEGLKKIKTGKTKIVKKNKPKIVKATTTNMFGSKIKKPKIKPGECIFPYKLTLKQKQSVTDSVKKSTTKIMNECVPSIPERKSNGSIIGADGLFCPTKVDGIYNKAENFDTKGKHKFWKQDTEKSKPYYLYEEKEDNKPKGYCDTKEYLERVKTTDLVNKKINPNCVPTFKTKKSLPPVPTNFTEDGKEYTCLVENNPDKITDKFTPQFICPTELDSDGVYDRVKSDKTEPCFVEK